MTEAEWLASEDPAAMLAVVGPYQEFGEGWKSAGDRKLRLFACACCRQVWHLLTDDRSRRAVAVAERFADGEATQKERAVTYLQAREAAEGLAVGTAHRQAAGAAFIAVRAEPIRNYDPDGAPLIAPLIPAAALLREIVGDPFRPVVLPLHKQPFGGPYPAGGGHGPGVMVTGPYRCNWLTPDVLAIAHAAYDERPGRKCAECDGTGMLGTGYGQFGWQPCDRCGRNGSHPSTGRIDDGSLDPVNLAILSDALEEASCTDEVILRHLRGQEPVWESIGGPTRRMLPNARPSHVRGCWALDLILGKE